MKLTWVWVLATYGAFSLMGDPCAALLQSFNQQEVIASCLVLEAGGEGAAGMQAVMNVIQNRAGHNPGRFYTEVARPQQFSAFNKAPGFFFRDFTSFIAKAKASRSWPVARALVAKAFQNALPDLTQGATHYYASSLKSPPDWAATAKQVTQLGHHRFLVLR